MNPIPKKIFIVAGEASGDQHASELIKLAKLKNPQLHFFGMGGQEMMSSGAEILINNKELALVGIFEIIKHLPLIYRTFKKIKSILQENPPDLLVLVDYPDFNLRLAKAAKKYKVKVLYFISPTIWAWRANRIKLIKKYVDKMAVIFPFEIPLYQQANIPVAYVGNQIVVNAKSEHSVAQARIHLSLDPDKITIGLLPGSRKSEIHNLLPIILSSAFLLKQRYPKIQFVLPLAANLTQEDIHPYLKNISLPIKIITGENYTVMQSCDALIAASGTVTLETALMQKPTVIIYKLSTLSYLVGKLLIKLKYIGLANIIADKLIFKEFIQNDADPNKISTEIIRILEDTNYRNQMLRDLSSLKNKFSTAEITNIGEIVDEMSK